jgi:hypothetical protein
MLHPIVEAACAAGLLRLVDVQRRMLAFACDPACAIPPGEAQVRAHFGEAADWVWERLWSYGKPASGPSALQDLLAAAAAHVRTQPGLGKKVMEAFEHDYTFFQCTDDAKYAFAFWGLDDGTAEVMGELSRRFYELLSSGVPGGVHGGAATLNLRSFKDAFWTANAELHACPACDRDKPDEGSRGDMSDADHFFPISRYPFLSIHPRNLVPVCPECNQRAKKDRDPIPDRANAPMRGTFHPYAMAAREHVRFRVERAAASGEPAVVAEEGGRVTPRVQGMINLWDLKERWESRLPAVIRSLRLVVADMAANHERTVALDEFRTRLEQTALRREAELGFLPGMILECAYMAYVIADAAELGTYYRLYLKGRPQPGP